MVDDELTEFLNEILTKLVKLYFPEQLGKADLKNESQPDKMDIPEQR